MVTLNAVRESNAALASIGSGKVALFVGCTSGLGLATLTEYARYADRPKIYMVARNATKLSGVITDLKKINPRAVYVPIVVDIALFKDVDKACDEFKAKEKSLDLLYLSPGYLKLTKSTPNADGLQGPYSLKYYVRMRFVENLLPQLSASPAARVMSVHGAGNEGRLNEEDLALQDSYSVVNDAVHSATMNTLALQEVAADHPSISCLHTFPGLVMTPTFDTFSEEWVLPLRLFFRHLVVPFTKLFTTTVEESGERLLFMATSARYPPASVRDSPGAGVALPSGVDVAKGTDAKEASGFYLVNWDGETVDKKKDVLDGYRQRDMGKRIWEHTREVFKGSLVKA